ncbi:MAG: Sfum_1244 family protein, partial [Desulfurivibrionaceae bacterium]
MTTEKFQAVNRDSRVPAKLEDLANSIQRNCTISDARFAGFYSLCILILRLRNLYKWEKGLEPWSEPDTPVLMEWVDAREKLWESLFDEPFQSLDYNGQVLDPLEGSAVNQWFSGSGLLYGAGYGRSLKPIFFLADKKEERKVEGIPLFILGKEQARELAAPFAMNQEEIIYIRREPLRFHLWDQIQEIPYTGKKTLLHALKFYQVLNKDGEIDQSRLIHNFDRMVDTELETFVYHEIGEIQEDMITSSVSRQIINAFPHSPIEFLSRAVRDLLADTNRSGLLS